MEYKVSCALKPGFNKISRIGDGELKLTEFAIINLADKQRFAANSGGFEVALVVLGGKCAVKGNGFEFASVGERPDVFSGKPHTVYIPCNTAYEITALGPVDIAWAASPSALKTDAYVIAPDQVIDCHIGKGSYERDAYLMLTEKFPSAHFYIGEAFVKDGRHASFPPHRHDFDNPPVEVDMEEVYFFRFKPFQGYGIQKIYTDDRSIDVTYTVEENDTTLIPRGYHPVIGAPGYDMYYLWVMAGEVNRKFVSVQDPAHRWVAM